MAGLFSLTSSHIGVSNPSIVLLQGKSLEHAFMAEAVAALGVVASVAQLADCTCTWLP